MSSQKQNKYLYEGSEWTFAILDDVYDACEEVALNDLKLDVYQNQLELISSEQMLDAYSSTGLPILYKHWSYGKHFSAEELKYRKGYTGLAYEIVINSNPCISYLMEENTITTQTTVIAHAAFGHNHFFKNNYLFKQWTNADYIIDYLVFARNYIQSCEERYGVDIVEKVVDSCHAIGRHSINKYKRPYPLSAKDEREKEKERDEYLQKHINDLWRTLPPSQEKKEKEQKIVFPKQPEENILYFIEKNSPILESWQREICRIVRKINQYFYPQYQTKVMNEGWATFSHYYIMNRLYDKGLIPESSILEFLHTHSNVLNQFDFDQRGYGGFNPYALGFAMFRDIKRMCEHPTAEDKEWFPDIVNEPWLDVCLDAVENYRDESFIRQFLSPALIRKFKMFVLDNNANEKHYTVQRIHNELGYKGIIETLAKSHEIGTMIPDIAVIDANLQRERTLTLQHNINDSKLLDENATKEVLKHIKRLWGYKVVIKSTKINIKGDESILKIHETSSTPHLTVE